MAKRSQQLFELLVEVAGNIQQATQMFETELKERPIIGDLANQVKEFERRGDELTGKLTGQLNAIYITPLEREDFLALALKMDDVIDGLEACTVRFDLYGITEMTPEMVAFAGHIRECANEIAQAVEKLQNHQLLGMREHIGEINRIEKLGDQLLRQCLKALFSSEDDPLHVIKHKEIYEILESVTDRCEDVADVLESVIVKNA